MSCWHLQLSRFVCWQIQRAAEEQAQVHSSLAESLHQHSHYKEQRSDLRAALEQLQQEHARQQVPLPRSAESSRLRLTY